MTEPTIEEIFKVANGDNTPGSTATPPDPGDGGVPVKSAEELEAEAAAAAAAAAQSGNNDDAGANGDGNNGDGNNRDVNNSDPGEYDENNIQIAVSLVEAISDLNGLEIDSSSIKTPEDVVSAIDNIIKSKAVPVYASVLSEEFDAFLKEGGNPIEFMQEFIGDSSNAIPTTQQEKEDIIRSVLKDGGFSDAQIDRKIDSYIENDTLDEELNDALDIIKRKNAKKAEDDIKARREAEAAEAEAQKRLFSDINNYIDSMTSIRDIPVTKDQAKNLKDYLLKFDKDGMTAYQRDFSKSISNLIESAFFTQNKAALIKAAQSKGSSDAMSKLKSVLKTNNKMAGTHNNNRGGSDDGLDAWIKQAAALTGRKAA